MNGLVEISINENKVGLKYGVWSFKYIFPSLESNKVFETNVFNEITAANIVYYGHLHYCIINRLIPQYSFEDIFNWTIDVKNIEEARKALTAFNDECSAYTKSNSAGEEEKKRLIGKRSKKQHMVN